MNIRQAILKAAEHIERNPEDFRYTEIAVPNHCGSPGCAIGWVAYFAKVKLKMNGIGLRNHHADKIALVHGDNCRNTFGVDHNVFYKRMEDLAGHSWRQSAAGCSRALRLYADKYHPAESRALIPESVRAIFTMTPEQLQREFQQPTAESLMAEFDRTIAALKR